MKHQLFLNVKAFKIVGSPESPVCQFTLRSQKLVNLHNHVSSVLKINFLKKNSRDTVIHPTGPMSKEDLNMISTDTFFANSYLRLLEPSWQQAFLALSSYRHVLIRIWQASWLSTIPLEKKS